MNQYRILTLRAGRQKCDRCFDQFLDSTNVFYRRRRQICPARNAARAARRFKEADEIRADLLARGIELEDTRDGTRWKVRS